MDIFSIIAGSASLLSLLFALTQYYKRQSNESVEKGNLLVLRERLKNIEVSLRSAATINQILIRRADDENVRLKELQNIARALRSQIYSTILEAKNIKRTVIDWKFGELLDSDVNIDDDQEKQNNDDKSDDAENVITILKP